MNKPNKYFNLVTLFVVICLPFRAHTINIPLLTTYNDNGRIAIQVKDDANFQTLFAANAQGKVVMDFYFAPGDPRNGMQESETVTSGQDQTMHIRFDRLFFGNENDLTFVATRKLSEDVNTEYKFHKGEYRSEGNSRPVTACPRFIVCQSQLHTLEIGFDVNEFQVLPEHSTIPVTFYFGPGNSQNHVWHVHDVVPEHNSFLFHYNGYTPCEEIMVGTVTILIGDMSCTYINGALLSSNCSPFEDSYDLECLELFEACGYELISLISDNSYSLICNQWHGQQPCTTTSHLYREGNVAIGTEGASLNTKLTVKNGVITDKVFVEFCTDGGWCDYVFEEQYPLRSLDQMEAYVSKYKHLPNTPSAETIESEGSFDLGAVTINQQEKIEEIYLHLIELEEELNLLEIAFFLADLKTRLDPGMQY